MRVIKNAKYLGSVGIDPILVSNGLLPNVYML